MASFISKKKKYKFQVEVHIEELLEVPFVSAVFFAKLRLLDGGNFQDTSKRVEVKDHKVYWNAKFSFPCKLMANASTVVLERCVLRISVRKECKGGKSFTKLGFVDLNLAEYAGSGEVSKKALLEGYDARHRQDNSMLKFSLKMSSLSGDILFRVPSPTIKHKQLPVVSHTPDENLKDPTGDLNLTSGGGGGSLAGSIASGSSGFGSLPKKRPPLLTSDLVTGHSLPETPPALMTPTSLSTTAVDGCLENTTSLMTPPVDTNNLSDSFGHYLEQAISGEAGGHSRNSSNTSQMSKASGYSSITSGHNAHSRQSSSGDSGHIRNIPAKVVKLAPFNFKILSSIPSNSPDSYIPLTPSSDDMSFINEDMFSTPKGILMAVPVKKFSTNLSMKTIDDSNLNETQKKPYSTRQISKNSSTTSEYKTPELNCSHCNSNKINSPKVLSNCSINKEKTIFTSEDNLSKSRENNVLIDKEKNSLKNKEKEVLTNKILISNKNDSSLKKKDLNCFTRSQSDFEIPKLIEVAPKNEKKILENLFLKSNSLFSILTPITKRKKTEKNVLTRDGFKIPGSPVSKSHVIRSLPEIRTSSLSSLRSDSSNMGVKLKGQNNIEGSRHLMSLPHDCLIRCIPHHKLLSSENGQGNLVINSSGVITVGNSVCNNRNKMATLPSTFSGTELDTPYNCNLPLQHQYESVAGTSSHRRPSATTNPSSSSLVLSETGSLDRAKAAIERRKKCSAAPEQEISLVTNRVEDTRVNPDEVIEELLQNTNLETTENSGLQLFIAKDGTAALGNHEVKSQMQKGMQHYKQVVVEDNR